MSGAPNRAGVSAGMAYNEAVPVLIMEWTSWAHRVALRWGVDGIARRDIYTTITA